MSKPIEIQKNTNKWEIINWFSYFKYDNGIITLIAVMTKQT